MANYTRKHDPKPGGQYNNWIINGSRFYVGSKCFYPCVCKCGRNTSNVPLWSLTSGHSTQCKDCANEAKIIHGHNTMAGNSPTHESWTGMIQRCTNPNHKEYHCYGGRGIKVHPDWMGDKGFVEFHKYMGDRPEGKTIDRYPDQNGNYEPGNCRWATPQEQARNRRTNRMITIGEETKCLTEWCEIQGLDLGTVWCRIENHGWTEEEALEFKEREYIPQNDKRVKKLVKIGDREQSISQWCREFNLNLKSVYSRMARGATVLEALGVETK